MRQPGINERVRPILRFAGNYYKLIYIRIGGKYMLDNWSKLSGERRKFVVTLALSVFALYILITFYSASTMYSNNARSEANHAARMNPTAAEPGKTPPDPLPAGGNFTTVSVGTYIDDIDN